MVIESRLTHSNLYDIIKKNKEKGVFIMKTVRIYINGFYVGSQEMTRETINKLVATDGVAVVEE